MYAIYLIYLKGLAHYLILVKNISKYIISQ